MERIIMDVDNCTAQIIFKPEVTEEQKLLYCKCLIAQATNAPAREKALAMKEVLDHLAASVMESELKDFEKAVIPLTDIFRRVLEENEDVSMEEFIEAHLAMANNFPVENAADITPTMTIVTNGNTESPRSTTLPIVAEGVRPFLLNPKLEELVETTIKNKNADNPEENPPPSPLSVSTRCRLPKRK